MRIEAGAYSHVIVPSMLRGSALSMRDRAFVTELVYGTLRSRRRLDEMLAPFGRRRIETLDPGVRAALRIGAHQLVIGVPPHAAVAETVDAAPSRARGYVNAVLRAASSAGPPWPEPSTTAVALSYPDWLVEQLIEDLGTDAALGVLAASNESAAVALRPNPARTTTDGLEVELRSVGAQVERGRLAPDALVVSGAGDLAALAAVAEGRATPQDQASQAVVAFAAPTSGMRVLDVAAAPGGKATGAGERVGEDGRVVALDVDEGRLRLVREAAKRLGLPNVVTARSDARALPVQGAAFDVVLVDAPCSGLGALRRRPDLRWRVERESIGLLADLQLTFVLEAARAVAPGGTLVYSVCTLTSAETVGVASRVLDALPSWEVLPRPPAWRAHGPGALVLPQDAGTDGMFMLGLRSA